MNFKISDTGRDPSQKLVRVPVSTRHRAIMDAGAGPPQESRRRAKIRSVLAAAGCLPFADHGTTMHAGRF